MASLEIKVVEIKCISVSFTAQKKSSMKYNAAPHSNSASFTQEIGPAGGNYLLSHALLAPSTNDYFF
jgi:hypothetical protein